MDLCLPFGKENEILRLFDDSPAQVQLPDDAVLCQLSSHAEEISENLNCLVIDPYDLNEEDHLYGTRKVRLHTLIDSPFLFAWAGNLRK
jgi:hypothetical protein